MIWKTSHLNWDLQGIPRVMGILNVTPDSFSDGGSFSDVPRAVDRALQMADEGAAMIDVGGESTRPNAVPVNESEELRRVLPVIKEIVRQSSVPVSIDTRKVQVAREALEAGAVIVNDVEAKRTDPSMWKTVAQFGAGYIAMHMQGDPRDMQQRPRYRNVVDEVLEFFRQGIDRMMASGVKKEQVMLDVGIGFGKTLDHNLALLRALESFHHLGCPLLLGVSRKSLFEALLHVHNPRERLPAGLACACWAMERGVSIIRTHDVGETVQALGMWQALKPSKRND
jgi:dihydropteroate synthase